MEHVRTFRVIIFCGALLAFDHGNAFAQTSLFEDGFEDGTCLPWSVAQPFCETPKIGIRIDMSWVTAGDPDWFDEEGSDLDLHVLHEDAEGNWVSPFDCYEGNPSPDWGAVGQPQNAVLVSLGQVGRGPEIIQITDPESMEYTIGVHYVDDRDFGPSTVTVRIEVDGTINTVSPSKWMTNGWFWELGSIQWPSGVFTIVDQTYSSMP